MRDFIDSVGATKLTFASMKTTLSANSFKSPHKSTSSPYQTWMGWKLILRRIWRSQGLVNRSAQVARHGSRMTLRTARRRCRRLFVGCLETCSGVSGCYERGRAINLSVSRSLRATESLSTANADSSIGNLIGMSSRRHNSISKVFRRKNK